ncbi:nitrilase family protein [Thalassoroseus pseudoceratinae]|uniref:nitrilase family protein n=1 Tax=Thalassoroseus pseudoceratinae TaxID=2713176 RepID=UPI0014244B1D|nr:nitrilase family protein [Thalassoroseus pseudoceratinae]
MRDIRIAAAQFEHKNADPSSNLSRIDALTRRAVADGAEVVSFHECCISAYSFVQAFSKSELLEIAEPVPDGPSVQALMDLSGDHGVPLLAGLFERRREANGEHNVYNTYVCVNGNQLVAKFSKLHAFVNPNLSSGSEYVVFDLLGCRCSILICYDNNLIENVRAITLKGAEVVFMPHVTGCLPSVMPGRGVVDPELWANRERDPVRLRQEFDGPKGRGWLMRWLPARAYDNGIYAVFTNPIGMDDGEVRNGNAMVLDPFGEVIAECHQLDDDVTVALCTSEKIDQASGRRYIRARRPDLYDELVKPTSEPPITQPGWKLRTK